MNMLMFTDEVDIKSYCPMTYGESQADRMEDAGWDESDVKERREYEDYMNCYTDVLHRILLERGIDPWRDYANNITEGI